MLKMTAAAAFIIVTVAVFTAEPVSACERECEYGEQHYSHGAKHPQTKQKCHCLPRYGQGESRTGPPAYYDCSWR